MTAEPTLLPFRQKVLMAAHQLTEAGYLVFPCKPWDKTPATANGFKDASCDPNQVNAWFDNDLGRNLAVACGPQPNGIFLYVVDVDPDKGGLATWEALIAEHGTPLAPRHETPHHGGFHLFFDAPGLRNSQDGLGPGVDTRGDGGYVVVPPSRLRDEHGEILSYRWRRDRALIGNRPIPVPDHLRPSTSVADSVDRHPSKGRDPLPPLGFQPWQFINDHISAGQVLRDHGWVEVGRNRFVRPGKNPRDGHSAEVHDDRQVTIFTSEIPAELVGGGLAAKAGFRSYTVADLVLGYRFGGDRDAFVRWVREQYGPPAAPTQSDGPGRGLGDGGRADAPSRAGDGTPPPLFLEAAWYEQRPWMLACRQMAYAVGGSPSAHLLAFLARWATLIPPGYSIPPINGAPSSFDLLCVIAGTSGSGKTSPMRNAKEMLPITRDDIRDNLGIGSGEGIVEMFYGTDVIEDENEDGKKVRRKERRHIYAGVNFSVSEGLIFADLAQRGGTTHVTRLCDAWSGAALSTANAGSDTFRHIDVNQYRLTLVMGLQADMAHELMTDSAASQGFVGRLLFAWAEEPRVKPRPMPPERLSLPVPPEFSIPKTAKAPKIYQQTYLTYPPEVYAECQDASDARVGTTVPVEEHHHDLLRCKIAGIVALMDGRTTVHLDDWAIATDLVGTSANVRRHLYEHRRQAQRDKRHQSAEARAEVEMTVDEIKERKAIGVMAESIRRWTTDQDWAEGALRKKVSYGDRGSRPGNRHLFERALALAITNGWVVASEGRVRKA